MDGKGSQLWHNAESRAGAPRRTASFVFLLLTVALAVAPLWQIAVLALEPEPGEGAWHLPHGAHAQNFSALILGTDFWRWMLNSTVVAVAATAVGVILSATAGYALSRFRFFGRLAVLNSLLVTQIFPATMLLLPIFLILVQLRLVDTFVGVVLVYVATVLPFGVWQMKGFYDTIPESIEEAAAMDGCTPGEVFSKVVIPISGPGLTTTALFCFAAAWNEYVIAAILLRDSRVFTLPLGLHQLQIGAAAPGLFAAGALVVTLPMLGLYLLLGRFLVARLPDITIRR